MRARRTRARTSRSQTGPKRTSGSETYGKKACAYMNEIRQFQHQQESAGEKEGVGGVDGRGSGGQRLREQARVNERALARKKERKTQGFRVRTNWREGKATPTPPPNLPFPYTANILLPSP